MSTPKSLKFAALAGGLAACGSQADSTPETVPANPGYDAIQSLIAENTTSCGDGAFRLVVDYPTLTCREGKTIDRYTIEYQNLNFTVGDNQASQADQLNGTTFAARVDFGPENAAREKRIRIRSDCKDYSSPRLNQWKDWQPPDHGGHTFHIEEIDGKWRTSARGGYRASSFEFGFYLLTGRPDKGIEIKPAACS